MNLILHNIPPLITFWSLRLNKVNAIISLYPHTLQQINTLEKIESDLILTTTWTTIFLIINFHITGLIIKKPLKKLITARLIKIITPTTILLLLFSLLNIINTNINTNNLILKLRIKKFYQSLIFFSIILFFILKTYKNKNKLNRTIYIPTIILTRILRPAEPTFIILITLIIILPIEISKISNYTKTHYTINKQLKRIKI